MTSDTFVSSVWEQCYTRREFIFAILVQATMALEK